MDDLDKRMMQIHVSIREMADNIAFIRKELPTLDMPDETRTAIARMCESLDSVLHDLPEEVVTLHGELGLRLERVELYPDASEADPKVRMSSIVSSLRGRFEAMHCVVTDLGSQYEKDPSVGSVYVLMTESGGSILSAFVRIREVLDAISADLDGGRGDM